MIICIVGPSCAGKTTSAEYIGSETGGTHYEASDFVMNRYSKCSFEGKIMNFVKREFDEKGMGTFARPICKQIKDSNNNISIISGFRTEKEIRIIREEFNSIFVGGVYANSLLRYQRKLERDNPGSSYSYRDFLQKDFTEYRFGIIQALEQQIDTLIINEGTFDDLYQTIDDKLTDQIPASK